MEEKDDNVGQPEQGKRQIKRRGLTTRNVYDKKPGKLVVADDPIIAAVIGEDAECGGMWLISGKEKNGKTSFALMLAKSLAANHKVVYISAEDGSDGSFRAAMRRAGITVSDRITWREYVDFEDIIGEAVSVSLDVKKIPAKPNKEQKALLKEIEYRAERVQTYAVYANTKK
jgi:predicted ATP-dependent serine protease